MSGEILVLLEHDRGRATETSYQALGFGRMLLAAGVGTSITAVLIGAAADALASDLGAYGAQHVLLAHHDQLSDYSPEAWGEVMAELIATRSPVAVVATGTDRGNEVLAHVGAIADLAFAANVVDVSLSDGLTLTRVRWGGSLLEHARLDAAVYLLSGAAHTFAGESVSADTATTEVFEPSLSESAARTRVIDRVTLAAGITLTTAAVVVSGGRGVGSADGFAPLVELADLLGGAVGCSRVVTNNGWRPHSDQVGQTGKRIAPELYIACGISGAIQHWVGMMASKHVLAINTDNEANMVGKAEYAVIGDLHQILPAVSDEIRRRRASA